MRSKLVASTARVPGRALGCPVARCHGIVRRGAQNILRQKPVDMRKPDQIIASECWQIDELHFTTINTNRAGKVHGSPLPDPTTQDSGLFYL
ncbi:hypothetical protein [Paracoccus laeviglucosivorans]|uniref:hypothetical protein n=1 Tax=Paracoccus laeviglucosivorans TaxID=1197861 RepID=UPI001C8F61B2|nr:hypothetical protein [Paracoccus laeviglucosivorans]